MAFYPFIGYGVFWIGLIASIVLYIIKKKVYPIMYLISIALYIFTIGFIIDVFNFSRNLILITLAISAIVFIFLGYYFSRGKK